MVKGKLRLLVKVASTAGKADKEPWRTMLWGRSALTWRDYEIKTDKKRYDDHGECRAQGSPCDRPSEAWQGATA